MNLLDVNMVLAAFREDHPHHAPARAWWVGAVGEGESFTVPDVVWSGFVRIVGSRRAFADPTPARDAFDFVRHVTAHRAYRRVTPGPRYLRIFEDLCVGADATGNLVSDAAIAAIAIEHDCQLVSFDRDFARFEGLRWSRPSS